jgi:hypothetical protein
VVFYTEFSETLKLRKSRFFKIGHPLFLVSYVMSCLSAFIIFIVFIVFIVTKHFHWPNAVFTLLSLVLSEASGCWIEKKLSKFHKNANIDFLYVSFMVLFMFLLGLQWLFLYSPFA